MRPSAEATKYSVSLTTGTFFSPGHLVLMLCKEKRSSQWTVPSIYCWLLPKPWVSEPTNTDPVFIFWDSVSLLHHWVKSKHLVRLVSLAAWLSTRNENYVFHVRASSNTLDARITESALCWDRQACRKSSSAAVPRWHLAPKHGS